MYPVDIGNIVKEVKKIVPKLSEENIHISLYEPRDVGEFDGVTGKYRDSKKRHAESRKVLAKTATGECCLGIL